MIRIKKLHIRSVFLPPLFLLFTACAEQGPEIVSGVSLELAQYRAGSHVLSRPLGVGPIPLATQFLGKTGAMPIGVSGYQLTDKLNVLGGDGAPLKNRALIHGPYDSAFSFGSPALDAACTGLLRSYLY